MIIRRPRSRAEQAARALVVLQVFALTFSHALWAHVWNRIGYRPRYGAPESWSSPPMSEHHVLMLPANVLGIILPVFGPPAALLLAYLAWRRRVKSDLAWATIAIVSIVMLWLDPLGAWTWYMD